MLIEKLFLNVLIVIAPVLVHIAFGDRWPHAKSPYAIGLLQGTSSSLLFNFFILRTRFVLGSQVCPACDFYLVRWTACRVHQLLNDFGYSDLL